MGGAAFEVTLSVSDRPELTSLAVTAIPVEPPVVERAAPATAVDKPADPEGAEEKKNNGNEPAGGAAESAKQQSVETTTEPSDDEGDDDDGIHVAASKGMKVIGWWRAKVDAHHGLDKEILAALHLLAGRRGPCMRLKFSHPSGTDDETRGRNKEGLQRLHKEMRTEQKSAVVFLDDPALGRKREVHLAAVWIQPRARDDERDHPDAHESHDANAKDEKPAADTREPEFLAFEVRPNAPAVALEPLLHKQLMVIFDLDETLLQAFTLRSMERRARELDGGNAGSADADDPAAADADASKSGWGGGQGGAATTVPGALGADARAATRDAVELERRRGEDRRRLRFDYDLLAQFRDEQCVRMPVPNASGQTQRIAAKMEPVLVTDPDGGEEPVVIHRPTIRVKSPHVRGGEMVFTRIDPKNPDTSMIVHIRPGWNDLYAYLCGDEKGAAPNAIRGAAAKDAGNRPKRPKCKAFVCTMSERQYAHEMWRLLDPTGKLLPLHDVVALHKRIVCVEHRSGEKKSLANATRGLTNIPEMSVVVDDRTNVWERRAQKNILAIAPFMPYNTDTGPGLQSEVAGKGGVMGMVQSMLTDVRYKFSQQWARWAARVSSGDPLRPGGEKPAAGEILAPLMASWATDNTETIVRQGGAARAATGAGSSLNAVLKSLGRSKSNVEEAQRRRHEEAKAKAEEEARAKEEEEEKARVEEEERRAEAEEERAKRLKLEGENRDGREEYKGKEEEAPRSNFRRIIPRPPQEHWMKEEAARVSAIVEQRGADARAKLEALAEMEKEIAKAKAAVLAGAKGEDNAAPMNTEDDGLGSDSDDDKPIVAKAEEPKKPTAEDEKRRKDEEAKRKKQVRACQQCAQWGIRAVDHFRSCKQCPFHKDYVHPKHDDEGKKRVFERLSELSEKALQGALNLTEKFQPEAVKDGRIEVGELEDAVVTRLTRYALSRQGVIKQTDAAPPRNTEEPEKEDPKPEPKKPEPKKRKSEEMAKPKGGAKKTPILGVPEEGYTKKHKSLNEITEPKNELEKNQSEEKNESEEEEEEEEEDHGPCVVCGIKDQEENEMLCDGCDRPFHNSCVGITDDELELMIEAEEDWFCEECVASGKNKDDNTKDLQQENKLKANDRADSDFNLDTEPESPASVRGTRGHPSERAPGPPMEGIREAGPKDEETGETEELVPKPSPSKSVASKYKPGTQREAMLKKMKKMSKRR